VRASHDAGAARVAAIAGRQFQAEAPGRRPDARKADAAGGARKKGLKPAAKRQAVRLLASKFLQAERRACRLVGLYRSTCRYASVRKDDLVLRQRIRAVAEARPRFGYRRIFITLKRDGVAVGSERGRRIYREE